ncbi:MAG TPA: hypothetical protein VFQ78_02550 [Candidatus Udaeobacter sp.]|nr:hypothetical protein [Candidatus Udaeobacter sp.]
MTPAIQTKHAPSRNSGGAKGAGGRPPKFDEPSRPVTLTLPESALSELERINPDRSHAIVELTKRLREREGESPLVEIVEMAKNIGLVVIGPSKTLQRMSFLRLVEVAPSRFLLTFEQGHDFHNLEIAIIDALEDEENEREQKLLTALLHHIKGLRKSKRVSMAEILVIRLR